MIVQKDILLKEVQHRVKNNLQIISSMTRLKKINDDESKEDFVDQFQERISSIAKVHDLLYQSNDYQHVDLENYISNLLEQFKNSFVLVNNEIEIKRNTVDRVDVSMDKAHHLGLIINEILSNAIKHSFDKFDSQKIIFVEIKKVKSLLEFKIWNNGHKVDKAKFEGSSPLA